MTEDGKFSGHDNVIPFRPESDGNFRVDLTAERVLRIKARMADLKIDQSSLASATGLSNSAISQIFTLKIKRTRHFPAIAKALKVNVSWLLADTDQRIDLSDGQGGTVSEECLPDLLNQEDFSNTKVDTIHTDDIPAAQFERKRTTIPLVEIDLSATSRHHVNDLPAKLQTLMMDREFVRMHTQADLSTVMLVQNIGDVMAPTLLNTDLLLIDTSLRALDRMDAIWLMRYSGMFMIRRVRKTANGLRLMPGNPAIPDEVVAEGDVEFLGRIAGFHRKL
ncbi:LexA family transcriptional regulator [Novosphingobium sp.]|uniref:XRE family transcriptional regulator n=1 Tax=Novosphingobium sp. TaxID=1874826 RepID=UPI0031D0F585